MINQRTTIRTIIVELIFFAILHSFVTTLSYALFADMLPAFLTLLLLVPYFGMFMFRNAQSIIIFLGVHIWLASWPLLLPVIWTPRAAILEPLPNAPLSYLLTGIPPQNIAPLRICWFIFMVASAVRSIYMRVKGRYGFESGYLVFSICAFTVFSLVSGYFGMSYATAVNAVWAFVLITGYLVYNQTARIDESLEIMEFSGRKPVAAIIRFNNAILAAFLIPVVLFAIISPWLPLDRAARLFGAAALAAIRGIFRFVGWFLSLFGSEEPAAQVEELPPVEQDLGPLVGQAAETPAWMQLLETIINVLIQITVVALIAAAIAYGAYRFYKLFVATRRTRGKDEPEGDVSEYIGPVLAVKPLAEALNSLLRRLMPKTEAEKIRRTYYKKVQWHIKHGAAVRGADTSGEIAVKLRPSENIDGLTALYERARYSDSQR